MEDVSKDMKFLGKLVGALSNKKYRENPNAAVLTSKQYAALNVGAINAEQTMYFCDSLVTGVSKNKIYSQLSNYYGIVDRDTALDVLEWLSTRGHRVCFEAIKQCVADKSTAIDEAILTEDEKVKSYEYIQNLNDTIEALVKDQRIRQKADLSKHSIVAWDMGRLVLVTRCCYEAAYISEEEAWKYINKAYQECRDTYRDWKGVADGYIIGRCMWGGSNLMLPGIMSIANGLMKDNDSPWLEYPLK